MAAPSIPDILERFSHPLGRRGRTTCPLHDSDNPQSFTYDLTRWYCFACNQGGGPRDLLSRLAPSDFLGAPPPTPSQLAAGATDGLWGVFGGGVFKPRLSQRLQQKVDDYRDERQRIVDVAHREAVQDWELGRRMLAVYPDDPAVQWWILESWDRLDQAERYTGCHCRERYTRVLDPLPLSP